MMYRAKHVTQWDGSNLAAANCRMAVAATHLDFHTQGKKTSTGAKMRAWQDDQSGGTDSQDAQRAWARGYQETLVIRDGSTWDRLESERALGRFIELDVLYSVLTDRCQKASSFGHTIGVAPESRGGLWLVSDPLCAKYKWMSPGNLRDAAEAWGNRVYGLGFSGRTRGCEPARTVQSRPVSGGSGTIPHSGKTGGVGGALARIRYSTAVVAMRSFTFGDDAVSGALVVKGTGHKYVTLPEGTLQDIPDGTPKRAFGPVTLVDAVTLMPVGPGGAGDTRNKGYIIGDESAFVIKEDCVFNPDNSADCSGAIAQRDKEWTEHLTPPSA